MVPTHSLVCWVETIHFQCENDREKYISLKVWRKSFCFPFQVNSFFPQKQIRSGAPMWETSLSFHPDFALTRSGCRPWLEKLKCYTCNWLKHTDQSLWGWLRVFGGGCRWLIILERTKTKIFFCGQDTLHKTWKVPLDENKSSVLTNFILWIQFQEAQQVQCKLSLWGNLIHLSQAEVPHPLSFQDLPASFHFET